MTKIEKEAILMIADISGYTKFMVSNQMDLVHAQVIINELITTIIKQVKIPLEISKLEGDAVFFFAEKTDEPGRWEIIKREIGQRLIKFFEVFTDKVNELSESNTCRCSACTNVDKLNLKIIVHSGTALSYRIDKFSELSGVDVIIAHKLLKNSVRSDRYILITEKAFNLIKFPKNVRFEKSKENYEEIGGVGTYIYFPGGDDNLDHGYAAYSYKVKNMAIKMMLPLLIRFGIKKLKRFNNIPELSP
ncbi:MAG: DUF2652 domain-containing protein [Deltaproteobacteria bacterium]|uniref:DUF2652 domain-containing protein n=1 Tax=Candidatus Zymogenus saltonus TaxID=2844893 RepID=A0A9D8KHM1_9DELT|nr:DUF2652 domain-containing protein [Candidatus Zymogenus saltonus]